MSNKKIDYAKAMVEEAEEQDEWIKEGWFNPGEAPDDSKCVCKDCIYRLKNAKPTNIHCEVYEFKNSSITWGGGPCPYYAKEE